ncbi:SseB family protein [Microbacterium hominis]|uniref:SseB family protein n=1 Tax=Microbacterium hominis TaxID=162426 RepID=A0A7D4U4Y5_9MICO|nr:SseB family protein [Microbacterium hominis]QKJ19785.1 SseB family protein [Microbacterium hominis]
MSPDAETPEPPAGPHHHGDSAGVPWEGRSFQANPHAGDDGSADPALAAALRAFRAGEVGQDAVVDAYRSARLLIPLVAEKGDEGVGPHGLAVDKTQELSIVTVAAPDGRRVLPVFSDVASMSRWDAAARPIPADGMRTALAASSDDTDLIVLDPGSPTEFVLRRPAVWAIAQGQRWEPSFASPEVYAGLQASIGGELAVLDLSVGPGDPTARLRGPELIVRLHLIDGLEKDALDAVLTRLATRWAADDRIAVLVDSLEVKLVRA